MCYTSNLVGPKAHSTIHINIAKDVKKIIIKSFQHCIICHMIHFDERIIGNVVLLEMFSNSY